MTQYICPDRLVAEDSLCSFIPSRVIQQVPHITGESNCLSARVITTLHTLGLSKSCEFLVSCGESRLVCHNSHSSSQEYPDPLCLILSTTTPAHRESAYSTTQSAYLGTQAQLAATQPAFPQKWERSGSDCRGTPMPTHCLGL